MGLEHFRAESELIRVSDTDSAELAVLHPDQAAFSDRNLVFRTTAQRGERQSKGLLQAHHRRSTGIPSVVAVSLSNMPRL